MLLKNLYVKSLEHPGPGFAGLESIDTDSASLLAIYHFTIGFLDCAEQYGDEDSITSWIAFREWLREGGNLPCQGWAGKIIDEYGDGELAINRFIELLYAYIKIQKPSWFVEFNSKEQPSRWLKTSGPRSNDIRNHEHVIWITST